MAGCVLAGPGGEEQLLYMNPNRDEVDATILSYELDEKGAVAGPSELLSGQPVISACKCIWLGLHLAKLACM